MDVYLAGAFAAFTVDMLIYPFDTLKTRRQSQDYLKSYTQGGKNNALALRGLYQGIGSVVLATLPAAGVFFSTYELGKTSISKLSLVPLPVVHSAASTMAEAASCLVLTPAELVKQHAQMMRSQGGENTGSTSLKAFRSLYEAGVGRRLFTGYTALLALSNFRAFTFPVMGDKAATRAGAPADTGDRGDRGGECGHCRGDRGFHYDPQRRSQDSDDAFDGEYQR
ncbi:mitochondrial carrier protein (Pet8) [Beauveria bassiana ARSEF 2860]|uniref:Mitochondrial carrier protein (Pet8) n=1 Tax=Beauveria bassiana (strain ARSEF 2860) TaxID=655819 RepID=J5K491_BEAB2|nr:mitochondrial carrier protein (Pet8) [Beauveria bassiana ARSEF 2860]EJP68871.1 mitochondrial carrier protein (Pet8) [Beauveria bassiana ARSEF 2860]